MNTAEIMLPDDEQAATGLVPADLMRAITSGADPAVITKLMDLHDRWDANRARKAFDAAMAAAKAQIPVIEKSHLVDFTNRQGQRTRYRYEDLADIAGTVDPILGEHGLSYRFRTESTPALVTVTCIVFHRDGHSEQNTLSASHDASGNKNSIQAIGSAVTYLQRYTLKAALGLAAAADDDGAGSGGGGAARPEVAAAYVQRWNDLIADATDDVELLEQWRSEKDLRRSVFRTEAEAETVAQLTRMVSQRARELQASIAAELKQVEQADQVAEQKQDPPA